MINHLLIQNQISYFSFLGIVFNDEILYLRNNLEPVTMNITFINKVFIAKKKKIPFRYLLLFFLMITFVLTFYWNNQKHYFLWISVIIISSFTAFFLYKKNHYYVFVVKTIDGAKEINIDKKDLQEAKRLIRILNKILKKQCFTQKLVS